LPCNAARTPEEIVNKINANFIKIKDAAADITMDTSLHIFGCSGLTRFQGKGYYKAPDKIKAALNKETYFARGNRIRKIDEKGKKWYVKLFNALDFSPGFNPMLIPHNFYLTLVKDGTDEIILEGNPKPGVLKNVKKVFFRIDPHGYLLRRIDLVLVHSWLNGSIDICYQEIDGLCVPVGFKGRSAIELRAGILVGLDIELRGENIRLNKGQPDRLFDPGF
jgi:hypothetical protein